MKSWLGKYYKANELSNRDNIVFWFSTLGNTIANNDLVFVVDENDPTLLYGWGTVKEVTREERFVIGDDEEAITPPYPTYEIIQVKAICNEVFVLPLSLFAYLSPEEFKEYEDEYRNKYEGVLKELSPSLTEILNKAVGNLKKEGVPVFLSYAHEDIDFAMLLYKRLTDQGFHIWIDKVSLMPGQNWKREIGQAIRNSGAFIALLSKNSINKRGYVQKELLLGLEILDEVPPSQIYLVPIRIEPCTPEHSALRDIQWVDLFPDFEQGFQSVLRVLQNIKKH